MKLLMIKKTNLIFCASRHDSHANIVVNSLKAGKAVFVEKPLAINESELSNIISAANSDSPKLMVGFNRRFSKSFKTISDFFCKQNLSSDNDLQGQCRIYS